MLVISFGLCPLMGHAIRTLDVCCDRTRVFDEWDSLRWVLVDSIDSYDGYVPEFIDDVCEYGSMI